MNAALIKPAVSKAEAPTISARDVFAPRAPAALQDAAEMLRELADRSHAEIADIFANDAAENFQALISEVVKCRAALTKIENQARKQLTSEADYFRENLESIEALGA